MEARVVRLKDGKRARVRPVRVDDAESLHACIRAVVEAGQGVVRTIDQVPTDHSKLALDLIEWTDGTNNGPCETWGEDGVREKGAASPAARGGRGPKGARGARLVAEMLEGDDAGAIVGEATIRRHSPKRVRHVAHLSIEVHPRHQGNGVGRALMNALLDWARGPDGAGLNRVDLDVFAVNTRAVNLYRSLGFEIEGTRKRFVRFEDGTYSDDHVMALML